jgi:hypothetical protein
MLFVRFAVFGDKSLIERHVRLGLYRNHINQKLNPPPDNSLFEPRSVTTKIDRNPSDICEIREWRDIVSPLVSLCYVLRAVTVQLSIAHKTEDLASILAL